MANKRLNISDFSVIVNEKRIVDQINMTVDSGETHLIIGPNGSGKSTLLRSIMLNDQETDGELEYCGKSLIDLTPNELAAMGIFYSYQEPVTIPGVPILDFLRVAYNNINPDETMDPWTFKEIFDAYLDTVGLDLDFAYRNINEGFSGGEKKKLELLQLLVLKPSLALIDEMDSGLDYRSIENTFKILNDYKKESNCSMIVVSHNRNILDYLDPDRIYLFENGKIVQEGGIEIINSIN